MDIKDNSEKGSVRGKESWWECFCFCKEYVNDYEQNVSGNMDIKTHFGEILDANKKHIIGNWENYFKMTKDLV